jgi:hypothetical protein
MLLEGASSHVWPCLKRLVCAGLFLGLQGGLTARTLAHPRKGSGDKAGVLRGETPLRFFRQFEVERLHVHHQACVLYGQDDCILV